jgi:hypothetical protein
MVADERDGARLEGSMNRHVLAEHIVIADLHAADLLRPRDVLRRAADTGEYERLLAFARC